MEIIDIAPDGDVLLIAEEEGKQTGIRASSAILSMASPVFKALLSPRFKEGKPRQGGAVEIQLLDNDAASVTIIGHVLRFKFDKVPFTLGTQELLQVAKMMDKYDLAHVFRAMAQCWIPPLISNTFVTFNLSADCTRRHELLLAAYYLGHDELFEKIGKDIVYENDQTSLANAASEFLPDELADLFRESPTIQAHLQI